MKPCRARRRRVGSILVLTAVMMVLMFALLAFAVDIGYVALVRTQMQSAADAAAMAATWDLLDGRTLTPTASAAAIQDVAKSSARYFTQLNPAGQVPLALLDSDITFGRLDLLAGDDAPLTFVDPNNYNATQVRVRRNADINGEVPTFFVRVVGVNSYPSQAEATAVFIDNFKGFTLPPEGKGNLNLLPFALDQGTWNELLAGNCDDQWTWDEQNDQIVSGPDGVQEVNLFPQGTGSPGNRGTVDIGRNSNSTRDIRRQILEGVNEADLECLGGKLELGPDGTLELNGDTGISAGTKAELTIIKGEPRIIPLFSSVSGPGNNAQYTIVGFAGIRIMEVKLTGNVSGKRVIIQPARIEVYGGIPGGDDARYSYFLYSPVWLVR